LIFAPAHESPTSLWIACRPNVFLPVRVLSRLFRRLVVEMLVAGAWVNPDQPQ
jgi:hypothetical protein